MCRAPGVICAVATPAPHALRSACRALGCMLALQILSCLHALVFCMHCIALLPLAMHTLTPCLTFLRYHKYHTATAQHSTYPLSCHSRPNTSPEGSDAHELAHAHPHHMQAVASVLRHSPNERGSAGATKTPHGGIGSPRFFTELSGQAKMGHCKRHLTIPSPMLLDILIRYP